MEAEFPLDDVTLTLLAEACRINPDTGQTHLQDFLSMGAREKEITNISDEFPEGGAPVYLVEYDLGFEPWSEQGVILALIAEIQRLRRGGEDGAA